MVDTFEAKSRRLAAFGIELAADAFGDSTAQPIVLLHGGGQTRHAWGGAAARLAATGRYALSVDLRGHGDSDWSPDGVYGMTEFSSDVRRVALDLPMPPVLVGASLGGLASLVAIGETARDAPRPVARALVLVDVTPRIEVEGREKIQGFMASGLAGFDSLDEAAAAIAAFLPNRPRPADASGLTKNLRQRDDGRWYWHWDPAFVEGIDRAGDDGPVPFERLTAAARRVEVPTLLVRGKMSDIVSDEGVAELVELIPHAEIVDVAGAGHMVAGDRNDAFNNAVIDFVDRVLEVR